MTGVNGLTGETDVMNVLTDNGDGPDTLGGTPANIGQVTVAILTPAVSIGGAPVPVLDPTDGRIDVPARTPADTYEICLLYTSPSPRDRQKSRMPSSA